MTIPGIRIRTPSRLHFGLLGWGPQAGRQFGGVGLMIDSPGIDLLVEPASSWLIEGSYVARIQQLLDHLEKKMSEAGKSLSPAAYPGRQRPAGTYWPGSRHSALPGGRPSGFSTGWHGQLNGC